MGIPSYYKKICDRIPGLLSKVRNGTRPTHLWVDFNCMVYHCLRRPSAKLYPGESSRIEWENYLINDVCNYLKKVVQIVDPSQQVFVGVDGVVPMAKMRQQRLRRFKSIWVASEEVRIGKTDPSQPRWDTNAITPGTAFMERLGIELKKLHSTNIQWVVSTSDEPGEGEHKIMNLLRSCNTLNSHVVYGLDADLIILSLLQPVKEMWLFREAIECGQVQYTDNEEDYYYFHIHKLRDFISDKKDDSYVLDYCMAMSFLGNDFLPHGLSLKIKDAGHDILLKLLDDVRKEAGPLIDMKTNTWRPDAFRACISWLAENEERWIKEHCARKLNQRFQRARGTTPLELVLDEWNKKPLRESEELCLVKSFVKDMDGGQSVLLEANWRHIYNRRWLGSEDTRRIMKEYLCGFDWVLQYYTGRPVDTTWYYPWFLPPLWSDIKEYLNSQELPRSSSQNTDFKVKPQEQLALVLPLQSWSLIRDHSLRKLTTIAPQFWPNSFVLFTAGHKYTWECEAMIPLLTPARLHSYFKTN
jgi:5'-3' exonuclease